MEGLISQPGPDLSHSFGKLHFKFVVAITAHLETLSSLVGLQALIDLGQVLGFAPKIEVGDCKERHSVFKLTF